MKTVPYQQGARKVTNHGSKKVCGFFNSVKNNTMIPVESLLEKDFANILEYVKSVRGYHYQPFKVKYKVGGKTRTYTPDVRLSLDLSPEYVIEIKPKAMLEKLDIEVISKRNEAITAEGYQYKIVTEEVIRVEPRLSNIKRLYSYGFASVKPKEERLITDYIRDTGGVAIRDVEKALNQQGITTKEIYNLLFRRILTFDINKTLTYESRVMLDSDSREDDYLWLPFLSQSKSVY